VTPAIVVRDLVKVYGGVRAVDGVSFDGHPGEVLAVLGHNGAGKTTTVEILEGHRRRDAGQVRVLGFDPETGGQRYRQRIGVVLQEAGFGGAVTVGEAMELFRRFWPRPEPAGALLEAVGLAGQAVQRVDTLSGGQRRRLDLALALVGRPEVLFLDEPTTGLDPVARRDAWRLIHQVRDRGTAVLLTTHYMEEAENLADRVIVMARGRVVAQGTMDQLSRRLDTRAVISFRLPAGTTAGDLPALAGTVEPSASRVEIRTAQPTGDLYALTRWATGQGTGLDALTVTRPNLEDVYFELAVASEAHHG
jgi:ABC-type multidrug transport system ATPase subunit